VRGGSPDPPLTAQRSCHVALCARWIARSTGFGGPTRDLAIPFHPGTACLRWTNQGVRVGEIHRARRADMGSGDPFSLLGATHEGGPTKVSALARSTRLTRDLAIPSHLGTACLRWPNQGVHVGEIHRADTGSGDPFSPRDRMPEVDQPKSTLARSTGLGGPTRDLAIPSHPGTACLRWTNQGVRVGEIHAADTGSGDPFSPGDRMPEAGQPRCPRWRDPPGRHGIWRSLLTTRGDARRRTNQGACVGKIYRADTGFCDPFSPRDCMLEVDQPRCPRWRDPRG